MAAGEEEGHVTLERLRKKMADFAKGRDWDQFHSPRNLLLALVGEVGELPEIFQWKGEVPRGLPDWEEAEKEHLSEELSDVLLYLVRLSDACGVDLGRAALRKMELMPSNTPFNSARTRPGSSPRSQMRSVRAPAAVAVGLLGDLSEVRFQSSRVSCGLSYGFSFGEHKKQRPSTI